MTDTEKTEQEIDVQVQLAHGFDQLGIRKVLSEIDLSEMDSNMYEFPVPVDGEPSAPVPEGSKMPRKGTEFRQETVQFDKFGFEVTDDADD
jgi:hypothetical protein